MQDLQHIDQINDKFTESAPTLTGLPDFVYGDLPAASAFTESAPSLDAMPNEPYVPSLVEPEYPTLNAPIEVAIPEPITATVLNITAPTDIPEFTENLFSRYKSNLALYGDDLEEWVAYINGLRDKLLPVEVLLTNHLNAVLTGSTFAPDGLEKRGFEQAQQAIMFERHAALDNMDAGPSAQTGLPSDTRIIAQLQLELKTLLAVIQAAGKAADSRQEIEAKHLQWAMELALRLADTALNLKANDVGWRMKMLTFALDGADATLDIAVKVLEFKRKELELITRYNKLQLNRYEIQLKAEKTKLESFRVNVANIKLTAAYNAQQVNIFNAALDFLDTRVKLYQYRVEYVSLGVAYRKLALQVYTAEVEAYKANTNAIRAEQSGIRARIKGDVALAEKEFAKVRLFNAQLAGELANARATAAKASAQAAQAKGVLAEYTTTLNAQLDYLRMIDKEVKTALSALVKGFAAEASEQELLISNQEVKDQEALSDALDELRTEQIDLTSQLASHSVTLAQLASQSKVIDGGAATLGSIASAAFTGLNGIAVDELVSEA
jgi:hypothetical protein